jgi:hypothetical protein
MALPPSCTPGDSVTCAILEVARAFSDGPSTFTVIATLVVPIFAALASTAVAVVSVVIANRAKTLAEASEIARVAAETDRVDREYEGRMHTAFIEVFGALARLANDLQQHAALLEHAKNQSQYVTADDLARDPSDIRLVAQIASTRLLARHTDEIKLLDKISELTLESRSKARRVRSLVLAEVWPLVILWQNASAPERTKLLARFEELRGIESEDAVPSWTQTDAQVA